MVVNKEKQITVFKDSLMTLADLVDFNDVKKWVIDIKKQFKDIAKNKEINDDIKNMIKTSLKMMEIDVKSELWNKVKGEAFELSVKI